MNKVKAVFFDMDGVLLDSELYYSRFFIDSVRHFYQLKAEGYDKDLLAKIAGFVGNIKLDIICDFYQKDRFSEEQKEEYVKTIRNKMKFALKNKTLKAKEGILDFLKYLKEKNIHIAVCSNAPESETRKNLALIDILDYMEIIYSGMDLKDMKPSPTIYLKALDYFNITPDEAVIFEDTRHGIEGGIRSHCPVIIIDQLYNENYDEYKNLKRIKDYTDYQNFDFI